LTRLTADSIVPAMQALFAALGLFAAVGMLYLFVP
jgi:hypothetical protein